MTNALPNKLNKYFLIDTKMSSFNYNFYNGSKDGEIYLMQAQENAKLIIDSYFSGIKMLSSNPVFNISIDKVIINFFIYTPKKNNRTLKQLQNIALNNNTINNLGNLLSKIFGRPVELRFKKMYYPYLDSTILAKYIAINAEKYKFRKIKNRLFGKNPIVKNNLLSNALKSKLPSHIVGIKIVISGRLITERVRPRQTVLTKQMGSFSYNNKSLIDFGSYTGKNIHGAYTVKVWINQRII